MSWVRLDDQFPDHPKLALAGHQAGWLFVCALCYSARYLTDGRVPKAQMLRLADVPQPAKVVARLVEVGLLVDDGEHWLIAGYLEWQPSRGEVAEKRSDVSRKRAEAGRKGAEKRWQIDGKSMANGMANEVASGKQTDGPVPVPIEKPPLTPPRGGLIAQATEAACAGRTRREQAVIRSDARQAKAQMWLDRWPSMSVDQLADGLVSGRPPQTVQYLTVVGGDQ